MNQMKKKGNINTSSPAKASLIAFILLKQKSEIINLG